MQEITKKIKSVRIYCRELGVEQISFGVMVDSLPRRVFFVPLAR